MNPLKFPKRFLLALPLSLLLGAGAHAQGPSGPSQCRLPDRPREFSTIDLDGDHRPDIMTSRADGKLRRIDVRLSSLGKEISLTFADGQSDVYVYACDVDLDSDADLIVADAKSMEPIAVWINDGQGRFRREDPWWCARVAPQSELSAKPWAALGAQTGSVRLPEGWISDRSLTSLRPAGSRLCRLPVFAVQESRESHPKGPSVYDALRARSPPFPA